MTPQLTKPSYDVAVSGYACKLPQADSPEAFWRVLEEQRCVISEIQPDRWSTSRFLNADRSVFGRAYTFAAGQVEDLWDFDPGFFGVSPREAAQMDPQQRLLLMTVWEAVEHAGLRASDLAKGRTGVYIGAASSDHSWRFLSDLSAIDAQFMTGNTLSIVSNRISYLLDLKGPSFTTDTACSSSFYALHHAVQALASGEIDTAIVGGVNALLSPAAYIGFSRATMLSPEGLCKAFDSRADGYARSEGAVAFVLRRHDVAMAHGDPVLGMVMGTGVNSDGRTVGMAMPSPDRQADLLRQMQRELQFDPDDLAFLECHGTGTPVGDPMEAGAIGEVFGRRRASPLPIGSAKTNFGHLEPASGLVGLLKAQMALEKGVYPASLHVRELNPNIAFDDLNLEVATAPVDLPEREAPWLAGVNSFGFGGANAHVTIRQADRTERPAPTPPSPPRALSLSAASEESLRRLAATWSERLKAEPSAEAARLVSAAAYRREALNHRLIARGDTGAEIARGIDEWLASGRAAAVATGQKKGKGTKTAFVFGGNGSQWAGMGLHLYETDAAFRAAFDEVSALFARESELDLSALLESDELSDLLSESRVAQPILFALQVALTQALAAQGLRPDAVAGHSVGEVAAAWCAGVLSLEDAVHLIRTRSVALEVMRGTGGMAAVLAGAEAAEAALAEFGDSSITIAADNSPRSCTIAGPVEGLKAFAKFARKRRVAAKLLDIEYPYHSPGIDPIRSKLIADLSGLKPRPGHATYVSSTSGREAPGVALDTEYWWRNARNPVQFREAVDALAGLGCGVFVEIAPRPVLQNYVSDTLDGLGVGASVMATLQQTPREEPTAAGIAAQALALGAGLEAERFFGPAAPFEGGLPAYPWAKSTFRAEPTPEALDIFGLNLSGPLLGGRLRPGEGVWRNVIDMGGHPWLADHKVDGAVVFPAAGYAEIALAAGCEQHGAAELSEFEILRPLVIDGPEGVETRVTVDGSTGAVRIEARRRLTSADWALHAMGVLRKTPVEAPVPAPRPRGGAKITGRALYKRLTEQGLDYGPAFQRVSALKVGEDAARAEMTPREDAGRFALDPAALDAAMHGLFPLIGKHAEGQAEGRAYLPVRMGRVRLYRPGAAATEARARLVRLSPRGAEAVLELFDEQGLIAEVRGLRLKAVSFTRAARDEGLFWRQRLIRVGAEDGAGAPGDWSDPGARARALGVAAQEAPEPDVGSLLVDALSRRVAWDLAQGAAGEEGAIDIASAIDLAPDARPLLARALIALEEDGAFISAELGSGALVGECPYPTVEELVSAMIEEAPERVSDLLSLLKLETGLPRRLIEGLAETAPARPVVEIAPAARAIWRAAERMMTDVAEGWTPDRRLEALVLGAPSAGVLARLAALPNMTRVTVTDADDAVAQGLAQVAVPHPALRFAPFEDAAARGGYDVILAGDGLARLDRQAVDVLASALNSGGLFLAVEPSADLATDLREGVAATWWEGTLTPEAPVGRRLPAEDWAAMLAEARLVSVAAAPLADEAVEAAVLTARAPARPAAAAALEEGAAPLVLIHDEATARLAAETEAALAAIGRPTRLFDIADVAEVDGAEIALLAGLRAEGSALEVATGRAETVRALLGAGTPAALWLVTRGGRAGAGGLGARRPEDAALAGLGRVLANEVAATLHHLDFAPEIADEELAERLAGALATPSPETRLSFDEAGAMAPRVEAAADLPARAEIAAAGDDAARVLDIAQQGAFDSLTWRARARRAPAPGEVEIEVRATGLNFRDVMWAQGLLPEEALEDGFAGATLGMECSGVVTRAGEGARYAVGQPVIAFGPAAFASHMTVADRAVAPLPAGTTFETAAAVPTIYITAQYGLVEMANLRPGETVLIHGGAGGVGLAAIQIARRAGARIFATAGSPEKRRMLSALGVERVFDSRSLAFADQVMEETGGEGVDVVLNSLFGEAMERSIACLRAFGRFVELGKRDYYANSALGLRPFRRNLSYFGVDADQLLSARPEIADRLFRDLAEGFESGDFSPPPVQVFEASEIVDAFRLMQKSGHVGKIVVRPPAAPAPVAPAAPIGEGAWVIVGGLGGFGVETANWLAEKGVSAIWLTSRSGAPGKEGRAAIAALRKAGVTIETMAADAAKPTDVEAVIKAVEAAGHQLEGVIHAAMVLQDQLFESLDASKIESVMRPKIAGAEAWDRATRGRGLPHFIAYSSVTTLFGNPGQAPYVAANAYLESLMEARRAAGEAGLAVAWGPIADIGYLSRETGTRDLLEKRLGGRMLTGAQGLAALDKVLAAGAPDAAVAIAPMRWGKLAGDLPLLSEPLFERVERARDAGGASEGDVDLKALIEGKDDAAALKVVTDLLAGETGRILRQPPSELDPKRPLTEMGFDSLMAVDLKMAVEERLGATLPLLSLSEGVSLSDLARKLRDEARGDAGPEVEEQVGELVAQHITAESGGVDRAVLDKIAEKAEALKGG